MTTVVTTPATVVDPATVTSIPFELEGLDLALIQVQKKDKSGFYHAFNTPGSKYTGFGVELPALATDLPTSVVIDGQVIALEAGLTSDTRRKKDPRTGVVTETKVEQRPKTSVDTKVSLPSFGGEQKQVKVIVSVTKAGTWNVIATVTKVPSPASPEERAAKATAKATSNLEAIMRALKGA